MPGKSIVTAVLVAVLATSIAPAGASVLLDPQDPLLSPDDRVEALPEQALALVSPHPVSTELEASPELRRPHEQGLVPQLQVPEPLSPAQLIPERLTSEASDRSQSDQAGIVAGVCTVTTTADSGPGSLRQCLLSVAAGDTINFSPAVFPPASPATIALASALPRIKVSNLTVDGSNAGVVLNGSKLSSGSGLVISGASGVKLRGLQILRFPEHGIALAFGATNAVIGGDRSIGKAPLGQGNLISGNGQVGVWLQDRGTTGNRVVGNYIGTNATGSQAMPNALDGILIRFGAKDNQVGGTTVGERNIISGNGHMGILIFEVDTSGNRVVGNYIGTDATGARAVPNAVYGVALNYGAHDNQVGGITQGERNIISGNGEGGVRIYEANSSRNRVVGNYIGTDATGTKAVPNTRFGVVIGASASSNQVGGATSAERNIISGNGGVGVQLEDDGTTGNRVMGNYIGTDVTGMRAVANAKGGVTILFGASGNQVGGGTSEERNVIGGNGQVGVWVQDDRTTGNRIVGNYIGTAVTGTQAVPNGWFGIFIRSGASGNIVGGSTSGERNLISGNLRSGIVIYEPGTSDNRIVGNYIGADMTGTRALPNGGNGVDIEGSPSGNQVGGSLPGERNLISGNAWSGVLLSSAHSNLVVGNYIGTDVTGTEAVPNTFDGVSVSDGARGNEVGGNEQGEGNLISGNDQAGVLLEGANTTGNRVMGNSIGTNAQRVSRIPNRLSGVYLKDGASSNPIGPKNTIAYNGTSGVIVSGEATLRNTITRNSIFDNGGLPIDFISVPLPTGPVTQPRLDSYQFSTGLLTGHACAGCRVEIFANFNAKPAGRFYLHTAVAGNNGAFALTLAPAPTLPCLSATATNSYGTTSEFSSALCLSRVYLPLVRGRR